MVRALVTNDDGIAAPGIEALARAVDPERSGPLRETYRIVRPHTGEQRWLRVVGKSHFRDGQCVRFMGVFEDVTEAKQAEEHRRFLTNELNHRMKNTLAITLSLVDNSLRAAGNVYIDAGESLGDNGIVATIALQNQLDQNGDGITNGRAAGPDANPEFSGEISASMCGLAGVVACAPAGTNNDRHFVVSPRNSDGSVTQPGARKRFYIVVSSD